MDPMGNGLKLQPTYKPQILTFDPSTSFTVDLIGNRFWDFLGPKGTLSMSYVSNEKKPFCLDLRKGP